MSSQYKAVPLTPAQVAYATRPAEAMDMSVIPNVKIMSLDGAVIVSGIDALLGLRAAVEFALGDDKS